MTRSIRDNLKRNTAQSINHLAKVVLNIAELEATFKPHHPDMAEGLEQLAIVTNQIRESMLGFALKAWDLDEEGIMGFM